MVGEASRQVWTYNNTSNASHVHAPRTDNQLPTTDNQLSAMLLEEAIGIQCRHAAGAG